MSISASMVKELRDRTGAGMMECKKALVETDGDMDEAVESLRKSGQAKADKKASRVPRRRGPETRARRTARSPQSEEPRSFTIEALKLICCPGATFMLVSVTTIALDDNARVFTIRRRSASRGGGRVP